MIGDSVWDDCWHIRVGGGLRCLDHDVCMADIAIGRTKLPLQFLRFTSELVQCYQSKTKDVALWANALDLEVGFDFDLQTLGLGLNILTSIPLGLGCLSLDFIS